MNIREAKALHDGMPVIGLVGTVKSAFEPRKGMKGDREWSVMGLYLTDESGEEIKVSWWSNTTDDWQEVKGRPVEISAHKGKNGLTGAKVEHSTYKGAAQVEVSVNGKCLRFTDEEAPSPQQPMRPPQGGTGTIRAPQIARDARAIAAKLTDVDLLAAIGRWVPIIRFALAHDKTKLEAVPYEPIQALVSTLLIAATSDRSTMMIDAGSPPPPQMTAKPQEPAADDDYLGGALDDFPPEDESQDAGGDPW